MSSDAGSGVVGSLTVIWSCWGLAAGHGTCAYTVKGTNSESEIPACVNIITSDEGPETNSGTIVGVK